MNHPVANTGYPRLREGAPTYYLTNFAQKLHEIENEKNCASPKSTNDIDSYSKINKQIMVILAGGICLSNG